MTSSVSKVQMFCFSCSTQIELCGICLYLISATFIHSGLLLHACHLVSHKTASSSAECSRDKPPFSFVGGQDSTMLDIVWVSPQGHRSVSVSRHFLLQALQCPCSVRKQFNRDHCCREREVKTQLPDCVVAH